MRARSYINAGYASANLNLSILTLQWAPNLAHAENQMGYRLLSIQEASRLPQHRGALGIDVERAQQITDDGMTFDIMRVKQVRPGSPGAQAGFRRGDQIIAVNGRVLPTIAAFAAYVGSMSPASRVTVDYIPAGRGPSDAERVPVMIGNAGKLAQTTAQNRPEEETAATGMSTRTKIGIAAVALFGCYELGCFSKKTPSGSSGNASQPYGTQQR